MENLALGIQLLCIGLPTVFAVLALIVLSGFILQRHMIPVLAKWIPEEDLSPGRQDAGLGTGAVPPDAAAAIHAAVEILTQGKYRVLKIDK